MFDLRLSLFLPALFMQVTSPYGDVLHHSDKVTLGQFAFTAAESGNYLACFKVETLERGNGGQPQPRLENWDRNERLGRYRKEKLGVSLEMINISDLPI
jgi:hypothetical protein